MVKSRGGPVFSVICEWVLCGWVIAIALSGKDGLGETAKRASKMPVARVPKRMGDD